MSIHIILNPASSSGAGGRMAPKVEQRLRERGVDYVLHRTNAPGHGEALVRTALDGGATRLLVVGGDGTIHEVANGLLGNGRSRVPMAVLPLGTGNDFYRMVGAPKAMGAALDTLMEGAACAFDVGRVCYDGQSRYFVNLLGIGIDVEVLRRRERVRRLPGLAQYLAALLGAVARFQAVGAEVELDDGSSIKGRTTLAGITVGPSAGGGFLLNPTATPDDGFLDLCWVEELNLFQILRYIPKVIRGTHAGLAVVQLKRFRTARLSAPEGMHLDFELDGELVRTPVERLEIEIVPAALHVMLPLSVAANHRGALP